MATSTTTPSLPAPEGSGKRSGKKLLIIALGAALLALGGLGAGAWFLGYFGAATQEGATNDEQAGEDRPAPVVLIDIPEITTSITSPGRRAVFVRLRTQIEIRGPEGAERIQRLMPRIVDLLQTHLREMRREEFHNERAMERLRQELLARIDIMIHPAQVERLLFREVIVQ